MNKPEFQPGAVFGAILQYVLLLCPGFGKWFSDNAGKQLSDDTWIRTVGFGIHIVSVWSKYLPAIECSLISMLEPLLNPVWVLIGYGENPGYWALCGGLTIIAALIFRLYWIEVHQKNIILHKIHRTPLFLLLFCKHLDFCPFFFEESVKMRKLLKPLSKHTSAIVNCSSLSSLQA